MNLSLYENAAALRGLQEYQDIIANNIAASHVAGFKAGAVGFEAVEGGFTVDSVKPADEEIAEKKVSKEEEEGDF